MEGISLSRKSSGRSTTSSMQQPRERPDSVQIFAKSLFGRRAKSRRDTSSPSSSGSSIYSSDVVEPLPPPPTSAAAKETGLGIFGRRRNTLKTEAAAAEAAAVSKKYQISGPYNFQHMTQNNANDSSEMRRGSALSSVLEFNELRAPLPHGMDLPRGRNPSSIGQPYGMAAEALHSPEQGEDGEDLLRTESRTRIHYNRPPPAMLNQTSPRRLMMQRAQSQDQLRAGNPPPRPPRSPIEPAHAHSSSLASQRISSHMSVQQDSPDELVRPHTGVGFHHREPSGFPWGATSPSRTSHKFSLSIDEEIAPDQILPRVCSPADDMNWPLPTPSLPSSCETALAGVPEECEQGGEPRHNRESVISNSSLRASQSVPMLRQFSLAQSPRSQRPASGASETLGRFDLTAAQRALRAALLEKEDTGAVLRDSWEDDIDWCYEHEAEADCDFAWDRSSLELERDLRADSAIPAEAGRPVKPNVEVTPAMLNPGRFDNTPSLSPCSQVSSATVHEAITPTHFQSSRASNFSLPRPESRQTRPYLHARKSSDASSFRESQGFTLSPSLLIPPDFQQQMTVHETERRHHLSLSVPYEEPMLTMDKSALFVYPRTSASTTGSGTNDTDRSSMSERHISTTSASTDFTRLTMSTTSLDMETYLPKPDQEVVSSPPVEEAAPVVHARAKSQGTVMPSLPETEEAAFDPSLLRRGDATHASDPNLLSLATKPQAKSNNPLTARRRARTTSLSTPPPPGQYALFPSVQTPGNRI